MSGQWVWKGQRMERFKWNQREFEFNFIRETQRTQLPRSHETERKVSMSWLGGP